MYKIAETATLNNIGVLVDAEESWIQDTIDGITMKTMREFNIDKVYIYLRQNFTEKAVYNLLKIAVVMLSKWFYLRDETGERSLYGKRKKQS